MLLDVQSLGIATEFMSQGGKESVAALLDSCLIGLKFPREFPSRLR